MVSRGRYRRLTLLSAVLIFSLGLIAFSSRHRHVPAVSSLKQQYPLLWKHVHTFNGHGGVWYMPPSWVQRNPQPRTIIEAAQLAIQVTDIGEVRHFMPHSQIPLIVHQTWSHRQIDTWPDDLRQSVEKWLQFVVEDEMAYFLWEDEGMVEFIDHFEPQAHDYYSSLPLMVEKTDYFRITVATCVGGIYGDLDTVPLKPPAQWITSQDVRPWTDLETRSVYNSMKPVRALFGIEADCLPTDHTCWRMGYPYSIQLTQWSFASARDHPLLHQYIENLAHQLQKIANHHGGLQTSAARTELQALDPLTLTGPEAVTRAAQEWLNTSAGLRWNALTGLHDGGKAKLVDDVLILPITSFSPGRGKYGNMGSKPITDPTALVHHHGQGS
ncbi:putative glycosyl transferase [Aspergillus flavus]|uniref:Glycosyl transferase n=2 Tax=Aspergillus subgen. Circumdati TaxID=2720871 RepID=A0A7G5K3D1_ASPFN|nr:uncharacterized protein G4B84_005636 [Aspergillus flavus NRRL3357]KAJ1714368.1 glycosyl transferase [Aspergillus flavus]OOO15055.1 glycosyltransferase sugar-binding region containing protein [Aspergillus oryzae]QMW30301.1 hypothetical protein G4B84_005636 [Aspergillus flavus NRRL3357]QMW42373.1 hypothetical protein G4B11_005697 [Aspergillus flavus]QRD86779.1 putative glycosyl transferase [Aspergillus flavus]